MKVYFRTEDERPLGSFETDYVPLVGDTVHLELRRWTVVAREFDSDPPTFQGRERTLFARVKVTSNA